MKMSSLPARGGWIEIGLSPSTASSVPSLPARGGWIEMQQLTVVENDVPPCVEGDLGSLLNSLHEAS